MLKLLDSNFFYCYNKSRVRWGSMLKISLIIPHTTRLKDRLDDFGRKKILDASSYEYEIIVVDDVDRRRRRSAKSGALTRFGLKKTAEREPRCVRE